MKLKRPMNEEEEKKIRMTVKLSHREESKQTLFMRFRELALKLGFTEVNDCTCQTKNGTHNFGCGFFKEE